LGIYADRRIGVTVSAYQPYTADVYLFIYLFLIKIVKTYASILVSYADTLYRNIGRRYWPVTNYGNYKQIAPTEKYSLSFLSLILAVFG